MIETRLDTVAHSVSGSETFTYHNNSPEEVSPRFRRFLNARPFDGGYELSRVRIEDASGRMIDADHVVRNTMRYPYPNAENEGQLIMPIQLRVSFDDGTSEFIALPADVWRANELEFTKGFFSDRKEPVETGTTPT